MKSSINSSGREISAFEIPGHAIRRGWSVYIAIAVNRIGKKQVYVGKVGDNRSGCNPMITRIGNHLSFNRSHSQLRNKMELNKDTRLKIHYLFIRNYSETSRTKMLKKVNQLERELNKLVQKRIKERMDMVLVNPYSGQYLTTKVKEEYEKCVSEADRDLLKNLLRDSLI